MGEGAQAEKGQARRRNGGRERREGRMPAADGGHRMGRGRPVRSPRAAASLPARRRRRGLEAPRTPGSLARPPVLLERRRRRRGPGRRGSQRRLLRAGPWLLCLGRRRQRRRQRPDAYGHHRPRQRALAGRAHQQPAAAMASSALSAPPPGALRRPRAALRSAPARGAAPPPLPPRARARAHSQSRGSGGSRAASGTWVGETLAHCGRHGQAPAVMEARTTPPPARAL